MKRNILSIIVACVVLCGIIVSAGCVSDSVPSSPIGAWVLASNPQVTIVLAADGSFTGQAPINSYGGTYAITGSSLSFGDDVYSTKMAGSPEDMAAEDDYFTRLATVASYTVTDAVLTLRDAQGTVLLTYIKG